ncbi:MAG: GNAT family N-acetyltransferase [Christensenellales bacterium]|jgi:ribosomal protein S18 acetylase RimI-like enzyme
MSFRLAKPMDAPQLKRLNDLFNGEGCNSAENIAKSLEQCGGEIVCVAEKEGELIGFCCGHIYLSMCYEKKLGEITEMFVCPEHRRSGAGKGMMNFMENELRKMGAASVRLLTGADNLSAQAFYLSCGYVQDDELLMKKRLK